MGTPITIRGLTKTFGQTVAVDSADLDIPAGDLFFLLGPSGCGKTTLLRMLAGFTDPDQGLIQFGERDMTHVPANKRNCGMMFQSYALWPHMTVAANVGFGLEARKIAAPERKRRVEEALALVQMHSYHQRKPNELSGGQQQRVALARALVIEPTLLLLDEPLSNLDAKLRLDMRSQIKKICKQVGTTAIYVTHDQKEALSMADGMAVLRDGKVIQSGAPRAMYDRPANRFIADFLGETNFIPAVITSRTADEVLLESPAGPFRSTSFPDDLPATGNVTCSVRPEALKLVEVPKSNAVAVPANQFRARLKETTYLGEMAQHRFEITDDLTVKVFELNPKAPGDGQMQLMAHPNDIVILSD